MQFSCYGDEPLRRITRRHVTKRETWVTAVRARHGTSPSDWRTGLALTILTWRSGAKLFLPQTVAETTHRFDRVCRFAEFLSQPADVCVYRARVNQSLVAPGSSEQHFARK